MRDEIGTRGGKKRREGERRGRSERDEIGTREVRGGKERGKKE